MTILEAKRICSDYYNMTNPSEEDTFLYTEALRFLIEEAKDADYMVELGGLYYEDRQFDLALKYRKEIIKRIKPYFNSVLLDLEER